MKLLVIGSGGREYPVVAIVSVDEANAALKFIRAQKHKAWLIGESVKGEGEARVV